MRSNYLQNLNDDITLVTPNRRMAGLVADRYHTAKLDAGEATWESPPVLPFVGWLTQTFRDLEIIRDVDISGLILLSPEQERVVWEQVVREGGDVEFGQVADLAVLAMKAWSSALLWELPRSAIVASGGRQEARAFIHWSERFQQRCRDLHAIDHHSFAAQLACRETLCPPLRGKFHFFGYVRLPSLLKRIELRIDGVDKALARGPELSGITLDYREYPNHEVELAAAARWARESKRLRPRAATAIALPGVRSIDPDLGQRLQRAFSSTPEPTDEASLVTLYCPVAASLADVELVEAALLILDSRRSRPWEDISRLLLSPYFGVADSERGQRALLDAKLRRRSNIEVSIASVIDGGRNSGARCPHLADRLEALLLGTQQTPDRQRMHDWMAFAEKQLRIAGWPGERELNTSELAALAEWQRAMDAAAELDAILPTCSWQSAISRWRTILRSRRLMPPTAVNAVQVITLEEAAFLDLDSLWVAGMHDGAQLEATPVSPFIPFSVQLRYGLPGADPNLDLSYANNLLSCLHVRHPAAIWSYAKIDGETPRRQLQNVHCVPVASNSTTPWPRLDPRQKYDLTDDSYAAPLTDASILTGGVGLFTDQAACPMRAFARHRLRAQCPDDPSPGLNAMQRGSIIHAVMAKLWARIGSSAQLKSTGEQELQWLLNICVGAVVDEFRAHYHLLDQYWELEHERLQNLSREWLKLELEREPFEVLVCEQSRSATIGTYTINTRVDRIDRLANGEIVIVDYKTGEVSRSSWEGPRPDQPQLPLYSVTSDTASVGGIAYARLKKGNCKIIDEPHGITGGSEIDVGSATKWTLQMAEWRIALEGLADEIEEGFSVADPKRGAVTCRTCDLQCLCRIYEVRPREILERSNGD